jgi:hypothetical protein
MVLAAVWYKWSNLISIVRSLFYYYANRRNENAVMSCEASGKNNEWSVTLWTWPPTRNSHLSHSSTSHPLFLQPYRGHYNHQPSSEAGNLVSSYWRRRSKNLSWPTTRNPDYPHLKSDILMLFFAPFRRHNQCWRVELLWNFTYYIICDDCIDSRARVVGSYMKQVILTTVLVWFIFHLNWIEEDYHT